MALFVSCRACAHPVKSHELVCPHCETQLAASEMTAAAAAAALLLSFGTGSCAAYGAPATGGYFAQGEGGAGAIGGDGAGGSGFGVDGGQGGVGGDGAAGGRCEPVEELGGAAPCTWLPGTVESPWGVAFGDSPGSQEALDLALADNGDAVVTGWLEGSASFGCETRLSAGGFDAFVSRLDSYGNPQWSRRFGDCELQEALDVAVDGAGDILLLGSFLGTIDLGNGLSASSIGRYGATYVSKLGPLGEPIWLRTFEAEPDGYLKARGMAVTPAGTIALVGSMGGAVDFGNGTITPGSANAFVLELDADGSFAWLRMFEAIPSSVAVDLDGNVVVTGSFGGTVDLGGGPLSSTGTNEDLFVLKLGASGDHLWSRAFANETTIFATSLAVDGSGNVLVTGSAAGVVDFGTGPLSAADEDVFLLKLDAAGDSLFANVFGDGESQLGTSITTDADDNIWISAFGSGSIDFGAGLLDGGSSAAYLAGFDLLGAPLSSAAIPGSVWPRSLVIDAAGRIVVAGQFSSSIDLPSGTLYAAGGWDAFVAKLSPSDLPSD